MNLKKRSMEFGVWSMEYGHRSMEFGVWDMEFGVWDMVCFNSKYHNCYIYLKCIKGAVLGHEIFSDSQKKKLYFFHT